MALEPAGVSLQAENFNQYIKQLGTIDKVQQDVFDADSSNVTKAFNDASKSADKYEKELKQVSSASKKAESSQKQLSKSLNVSTSGLNAATAGIVAFATGSAVTFAGESAKLAAQFQSQQTAVTNLAATFGESGNEIRNAITRATQGTLSQTQIAGAALTGLQFEVATTAENFERFAAVGATLGRARGIGAAEGIQRLFEGIGKRELELLDELGISTRNVNSELETLAQQQFNATAASLTQLQRETLFVEAALTVAEQKAADLGGSVDESAVAFERLAAQSENLQLTFGALVQPLGAGIADALSRAAVTAQQFFAFLGAGFTATGTIATGVLGNIVSFFKGEATRSIDDILNEATILATDRFKDIASTISGVSFDEEELVTQSEALEEATQDLTAYQNAIKQAEQLQLSFARAAEDAALKASRAAEDVARRQAKAVAELEESQVKDRDKLLQDQQKQLDDFETDRRKQIQKAERDIRKARQEAADQRKRDQEKLQRELARAQEKFNLSQLQSERRFNLSEQRLRAEGDILALQQLREDRDLERQEEKENFDQSQKDRIQSAEETQREQAKDLEAQLEELKANLDDQRGELLKSFDEQLAQQQKTQAEARALQQKRFAEEAAERAIALQREEEDRRISQARQLEDLGRSLADQEGVTAEGTQAIADELEKVFGQAGVADNIFSGFTARTESSFKDLFADLEDIVSDIEIPTPTPINIGASGGSRRIGGLSEFQEGGIVPGPVGSPQVIRAHGGETVLPTHRQSFSQQMIAPVIPSQNLNVAMSGGFNISGGEQAGETAVQAALVEMTENFRIAVDRVARRN